jgi:hypothetical protein
MSVWISWPAEFTLSQTPDFTKRFPLLGPHKCLGIVSPATGEYNCFAWAASATDVRWEPDPQDQYYWPDGVPREYSLPAFTSAYRTIGFEVCDNDAMEPGFEKIAIYSVGGFPLHAARQLDDGNWTTKFGDWEDVQHIDLESLNGPRYGAPSTYMKRIKVRSLPPIPAPV